MVESFAVVDQLRIRFHPGLNLLTGETGSGKSIVVDALGLLWGGRAASDMVRAGEPRARISGIFDVSGNAAVQALLEQAGLEAEHGELLIEREVLPGGKSRAFIGSRPATVALLREIAPHLGDIHGQHDQQLLFSAESQREMLDAFTDAGEIPGRVRECFGRLRAVESELAGLERTEQEKLRLLDLWQFQRNEIESARPRPGEDAALESERRVLQNMGRLLENGEAAYAALYDSPESAFALIRAAAKRLEELGRIDTGLAEIRESLRPAEIAVQDASHSLQSYLARLEPNPGRLEEIESRLAALDRLKRKYGASVEQVLEFLEQARGQINAVEHAGERMEALRATRAGLMANYDALARDLSGRRAAAARKLERRVEKELASLAMERAVFRIALCSAAPGESGTDAVAFLVTANPGEAPKPLEKVASGGELSRIALALKTCVAGGSGRTLVFDEVDAGIGGRVAEDVGRRLKRLAAGNQILCVTHLPQIACFADHHYVVEKREKMGRASAGVEELDAGSRVREIGRMLSGQKLTPEALRHAEQMLRAGYTPQQ